MAPADLIQALKKVPTDAQLRGSLFIQSGEVTYHADIDDRREHTCHFCGAPAFRDFACGCPESSEENTPLIIDDEEPTL